jgi:hypothetical protein
MTASRTAIAAVVMTTAVVLAFVMLKRLRSRAGVAVIMTACFLALSAVVWRFLPAQFTGQNASDAVTIRRLFLQTTSRMLQDEPLFGVGIGQYGLWSGEYAPPELLKFYPSENAHNNFAQVAGELGLIGLVMFMVVLGISLARGERPLQTSDMLMLPMVSAVAVFMLTWLGGHPLLVPEVSYPFWLALGLASAVLGGASIIQSSHVIVGIAFAFLLASMPLRVSHKAADLDMTRIRYGITEKGMMGSRGRLFVPAGRGHIDLPMRSRIATRESPIEVDVLVDGHVVDTVSMVDDQWLTRRIQWSSGRGRYQEIDLQLRRPDVPNGDETSARRSVEIGDWSIISKPHG